MMDVLAQNKTQAGIDKSQFLTAMGLVMEKHGISWSDVDVDYKTGIINIKTDMEPAIVTRFLMDVQETAGAFD